MSRRPPSDDEPYTGDTLPLSALPQPPKAPEPATRPKNASARLPGWGRAKAPPRATPRSTALPRPAAGRVPQARSASRVDPRRLLSRLGMGLLLLLLLACVGLLVVQQQVARAVALRDVRPNRPVAKPLMSPMNILLLGMDTRPDRPEDGVRSDSLILLRLDPLGGWANLLSIPRDSVAEIPGYGSDKINAAFAYGYNDAAQIYGAGTDRIAGGAALAAQTTEQFLGLRDLGVRIDYMATVDFDGFAKMIDALGGIDVDVPRTIVDNQYPTPDYGVMRIEIPAGRQHFDGARALQYVRTRYADSDFGRAERQQQVLRAMADSLRQRPLPFKIIAAYRLLRAAGAAIRTTLPVGRLDALLLGLSMLRFDPAAIGNYRIAPDTATLSAVQGSNLVWDAASVQKLARATLARRGEAQEQAVIQVRNGTGVTGLAGQVTALLNTNSFTTVTPGDDPARPRSVIYDYTNKPRTRARLQQVLGGMRVEQRSAGDAPPGVDLAVILGDDYAQYVPQR